MSRSLSNNLKANLIKTSSDDVQVVLLEVYNPALLSTPIRVNNSQCDIVSNGFTYIALPFEVTIDDDQPYQLSVAKLSISNITREFVRWVEILQGAPNSKMKMLIIQSSNPNFIEHERIYDIKNIVISNKVFSCNIIIFDNLNMQCNPLNYRSDNAPGLF